MPFPGPRRDGPSRAVLLRRAALQVHLWLSIALSVVVVVVSATGAVLVFRHEIDRALNPELFASVTPGDIGFECAHQSVRGAFPQRAVDLLRSPERLGVYEAELVGEPPLTVYVDPGSGRVTGSRDPDRSAMGILFWLHFDLLAGDVGHTVVGLTGIGMLVTGVTGVWVWWPGRRKWRQGFTWRSGRPLFVTNYDVHKLSGIYSLPLLLLVTLTGVLLVFYNVGSRIVHAAFLSVPAPVPRSALVSRPDGRPALDLDALSAAAEAAVADSRITAFIVPTAPTDAVKAWVRTPGDPRPNVGSSEVWLDQYSGAILALRHPGNRSLPERIDETWIITLHFGRYAALPGRLVYVLLGLLPLILLVTGLIHWWLKRGYKRRSWPARGVPVTMS